MKDLTKKILISLTLMSSLEVVHAAYPDQPIKLVRLVECALGDCYRRVCADRCIGYC